MKWFIFGAGLLVLMVLSAEDLRNRKIHAGFMVMMGIGLCVLQEFYLIISGRQDHIEMIHWCMGAAPGAVLLLLGKVTGGRIGIAFSSII